MNWGLPAGNGLWGNLTGIQSDFYNDADQGSRQALDEYGRAFGLVGNQQKFLGSNFAALMRQHAAWQLAQPKVTGPGTLFTDWVRGGGAGTVLDQYNNLSAQDRGFNVGRFQPARKMF